MTRTPVLAVAIATLICTACATVTVSSYRDSTVDFASYRTFDWGPADALPTGDLRLDSDPYFQDRLQGAIERGLARRKLERSAPEAPADLLIHYHASVNRRLDANRVDHAYGYVVDVDSEIRSYEAGTIVLDIVDRRTNHVIWRGWAQGDMTELLEDEQKMAEWIERAVQDMLARLSPLY
jgi:Domain of unknown function (DUF4136)